MNNFLGISEKSLATYLQAKKWQERYYLSLFPTRYTPFLTYETLIAQSNGISAAEIVSYDSSSPLKSRKTVDRLRGDIPGIRIARNMNEVQINEATIIKHTVSNKNDQDMQALYDLIYDDVNYVVEAVNSRMEWIALQMLSQAKITLDKTNSAGVITESAIDFQLPSANKIVCSEADRYWTVANASTSKPITDIRSAMATAKAKGIKIKYILMNVDKLSGFLNSAETKEFIYGIMISESGIMPGVAPTLETVNRVLNQSGLPQIQVIDAVVDLEDENHDVVSVDPWTTKYVTFIPDMPLGKFLYGPIAAENVQDNSTIQHKIGHVLVQSITKADPVSVKTLGLCNAFPSWGTVGQCLIMNTESHTTW